MNRELILRVRGPEGQYRLTVGSRDTYGELLIQVLNEVIKLAKKLNYQIKDLIVSREDNRPIAIS